MKPRERRLARACTSYRALYAALAELSLDLLKHVSLENNVLFPRAVVIEDGWRTTAAPRLAPVPRPALETTDT